MRLTADQELRRELLQFALSKQSEIEAAIEMASRMERFILEGCREDPGSRLEPSESGKPNGADQRGHSAAAKEPAQSQRPCQLGRDAEERACQHRTQGDELRKRRWSSDDDARLKQAWPSQAPLEQIAVDLDRTVPSLYSRARALGLARRDQHEGGGVSPKAVEPRQENGQKVASSEISTVIGTTAAAASRGSCSGVKADRYRLPRFAAEQRGGSGRQAADFVEADQLEAMPKTSVACEEPQFGVDSIIQFLRSRDYSVVRVEEGQFSLDGRRVLSVDQLRDKANQVRKSLGLPPFVQEYAAPAE